MNEDLVPESLYWAKEVLKLEPDDPDAHFVLAVDALEGRTPNVPEARRHLKVLEEKKAPLVRRLWIRAKLADATGDAGRPQPRPSRRAASLILAADCPPIDRITWLRIVTLADPHAKPIPPRSAARCRRCSRQVKQLTEAHGLAPARVARLRTFLELDPARLDRALVQGRPRADRAEFDRQVEAIEARPRGHLQARTLRRAGARPATFLSYADHLRCSAASATDACEVVDQALKSPQAARRNATHAVMGLHTIAVEMALAQGDDDRRFDKAAPHVQALLDCTEPRFQGLGHFSPGRSSSTSPVSDADSRRRESAGRCRPEIDAEAACQRALPLEARRGPVARHRVRPRRGMESPWCSRASRTWAGSSCRTRMRLGSLDSQYQLWAAWTVLQAGYPEEAEPIINSLVPAGRRRYRPARVERGALSLERRGTPERAGRRKTSGRPRPSSRRRIAAGPESSATVLVRLAQIDVQLGEFDKAIARIDALEHQGKGSPSAEQLAILTLEEQGKKPEARARLEAARARYPQSAELAGPRRRARGARTASRPTPTAILAEFPQGLSRPADARDDAGTAPGRVAQERPGGPHAASGHRRSHRKLGSARPARRARARAQPAWTPPRP